MDEPEHSSSIVDQPPAPPPRVRVLPGPDVDFSVGPASHYETPRVSLQDHTSIINVLEGRGDVPDSGSGPQLVERPRPISPRSPDRDIGRRISSHPPPPAPLDWIVPVQSANGSFPEKRGTVEDRLGATLGAAKIEQEKYAKRAHLASLTVNGGMFLQIVLNALITGLSAARGGRNTQIGVAALGALGTVVSSFLVRVRGTREPERSVTHSQKLEKFIRELEAFILDHARSRDPKFDPRVKWFREEFDIMQTAVHQSENGQPMQAL